MASLTVQGVLLADIVEARFPFSGQVILVVKKTGNSVHKGNLLAALDKRLLQADLNRQLSQYEQVRAQFEIFAKKYPNPGDDIIKYQKSIEQSQLNSAVNEVESAKLRLDQTSLISPVSGLIIDDGACRVGQYVTPASSAYKILDQESFFVHAELDLSKLKYFSSPRPAKIKIKDIKEVFDSTSSLPLPGPKSKFVILFKLTSNIEHLASLVPSLPAEVSIML